ncbi:metallophosphoesterase [Spirochaetia bacterium]|nr:metallophosphoesterase [Spirochaetia bacterium]
MKKNPSAGGAEEALSQLSPLATLDISGGDKALIISDFHMGAGRYNDFENNGGLVSEILENYYYKGGWNLILNGDIEELQLNRFSDIQNCWSDVYRIFDLFAAEGRLFKNLGNHDEELVIEKNYPYELYNAVRIDTGSRPVYVYHGHQSSKVYTDYNNLIRAGNRYFFRPMGFHNISSARSPRRRFHVEKQAYVFSLKNHCISVIGHTHRALFESLGRFDFIKFEIERLCRDYPGSGAADRERIAGEVVALRAELRKLRRSERRDVLRQSLYGDELPVPCLFNSGSSIGKKGITAIELDNRNISLVYWFNEGAGRKFIYRGWYRIEHFPGSSCCRAVLNHDRLDYVNARIELLGQSLEIPEQT